MVPEVAVNFFTLLQGNTLLLNVRDGVHCFYNLYIAVVRISGRACILPNLLPCPHSLSLHAWRDFSLAKGLAVQIQETAREGMHRDPTQLFQKAEKCSSLIKKLRLGM